MSQVVEKVCPCGEKFFTYDDRTVSCLICVVGDSQESAVDYLLTVEQAEFNLKCCIDNLGEMDDDFPDNQFRFSNYTSDYDVQQHIEDLKQAVYQYLVEMNDES